MKHPLKIFLLLIFGIAILAFAYFFNKPGRDVTNETSISVTASKLYKAFTDDETKANNEYLDKAISVNGTIGEINTNQQGQTIIIFQTDDPMFGVACTLKENKGLKFNKGSDIVLKGICSGFTSDVVLRDCIPVD
jgi:hypothetical protein